MKRMLPAEWYKQSCVQLTWPHENTDWRDYLNEADECFYNIAGEIVKREKLIIVCEDIERVKHITKSLDQSKIIYCEIENNDTWARDHGGITVFDDNRPIILNYQFNGWGMKFPANKDNQITRKLQEIGVFSSKVVLEHHKEFVV